jgi:hypothetical protein
MFFFALSLILFFVSACSNSGVKPIETPKRIHFIVALDGVAVNSRVLNEEDINKIVDWHNNATYLSEEKGNIIDETVPLPLAEKFSGSNISIKINPNWNVRMIYKEDNVFKVIHFLQGKQRAYYIKSSELLEFLKENESDD